MCGRFSLTVTSKILFSHFAVEGPDFEPRYNIAPSQEIIIIREDLPQKISYAKWGLIPHWAKEKTYAMINARAETVDKKPAYKSSFRSKRCLIPADSFYEWKEKIPYRYMMQDETPFAFAGIWDEWKRDNQVLITCSIITTEANSLVKKIHDRMPVILENPRLYLEIDEDGALKMLKPFDPKKMKSYKLSKIINSPKNDHRDVIKPMTDLSDF